MNSRGLTWLALLACVSLFLGTQGCDKLVTDQVTQTTVDSTLGQACLSCHNDNSNLILRPQAQVANSKHYTSYRLIDAIVTINTKPKSVNQCGPECHTNEGYIKTFDSISVSTNGYTAIGCFTCHQPHTGPYAQWDLDTLRAQHDFTVLANDSVFRMGKANMCAHCHQASNEEPSGTAAVFLDAETFGPHFSPQADVLNGTGGFHFAAITLNANNHRNVVTQKNGCLSCHFGSGQNYDYGQHTFRLQSDDSDYQFVNNCNIAGCHSTTPITDFYAFATIDSITTLGDSLKNILQQRGYLQSNGIDFTADLTIPALNAKILYNYLLYAQDGSRGVHNPEFMLKLLKQTVAQADSFPPTAAFVTTDTTGCIPYSATFSGASSDGANLSWHWNFGDGDSATGVNPTHIYDTAGTYTVRLIVVNAAGRDTATTTNLVRVIGIPIATITTADSVVSPAASIQLFAPTPWGTSFDWSVTDSVGTHVLDTTTTVGTLQFSLADEGLYSVTLSATGTCGTDDSTFTNLIRVTTTLLGLYQPAIPHSRK